MGSCRTPPATTAKSPHRGRLHCGLAAANFRNQHRYLTRANCLVLHRHQIRTVRPRILRPNRRRAGLRRCRGAPVLTAALSTLRPPRSSTAIGWRRRLNATSQSTKMVRLPNSRPRRDRPAAPATVVHQGGRGCPGSSHRRHRRKRFHHRRAPAMAAMVVSRRRRVTAIGQPRKARPRRGTTPTTSAAAKWSQPGESHRAGGGGKSCITALSS
jgi:hypothetical protein